MARCKRRVMHGKRLRRSAFKKAEEAPQMETVATTLTQLSSDSPMKSKAVDKLELDRQFKRKRRAKWYNAGDMHGARDTYEAQDFDNLATTGQFIPSDTPI